MPPSGFSSNAVRGALMFVKGCYIDLLEEVRSGKHESYEEGIEFELRQIDKALSRLHIDADGRITERELPEDFSQTPESVIAVAHPPKQSDQ